MKASLSPMRSRLIDSPIACLLPAYVLGVFLDPREVNLEAV